MEDWRREKKSWSSKCGYFLKTNGDSMGDMTFLVGPEAVKIKAFKILLMIACPVFEKMFGPTWSQLKGQAEFIRLRHTDPVVFSQFIKLVMTDDVTTDHLKSLNLSMDQMFSLFYMTKEYLTEELNEKCEQYIRDNTRVETVLEIYENLLGKDDEKLETDTLAFIVMYMNKIIVQKEFVKIPSQVLTSILSNCESNVNEIDLFHAMCRWVESQPLPLTLKGDAKRVKIRQMIRSLLPEIRLPQVTNQDFGTHIRPKEILDEKESLILYDFLSQADSKQSKLDPLLRLSDALSVRTDKRKLPVLRSLLLTDVDPSNSMLHRNNPEEMWIKASQNIRIDELGFYGPIENDAEYLVDVSATNPNRDPEDVHLGSKTIMGEKDTKFYFHLDNPLFLLAHETICLYYYIEGPPTGTAANNPATFKTEINQDDIIFNFRQRTDESSFVEIKYRRTH